MNQSYNEVSPHTGHNGHHGKDLQRIITAENVQPIRSSHGLVGNVNGEAMMETSMEVPRNTRHRGII